jgi:hypothetical protein
MLRLLIDEPAIACFHLHVSFAYKRVSLQATCGIIFRLIKAEGVRQMFFSATVRANFSAPLEAEF